MTLPVETIADGTGPRCEGCGKMPKLDIYRSAAGFYIGTYCHCGPYTRESGYYLTRELAQAELDSGAYGRSSGSRRCARM